MNTFPHTSLEGGPKYEMVYMEDMDEKTPVQNEPFVYQRARVLCSYDAKDTSELNLIANEVSSHYAIDTFESCQTCSFQFQLQVIFVAECAPANCDYMNGKQGLLKGLVPKAFLEILED